MNFSRLGEGLALGKFNRAHFELFGAENSKMSVGKSSNARILSFSGAENSKMSAFELFQAWGRARLGESSNTRILSVSGAENSKMSAFELF